MNQNGHQYIPSKPEDAAQRRKEYETGCSMQTRPLVKLCHQLTLCVNLKLTGSTRNIDLTHNDTMLKDLKLFHKDRTRMNLYKSKSVVVQ